ncbi:MAG: hypothetical protein ABIR32_04935 [Ilumatobacteraceae bacterium]
MLQPSVCPTLASNGRPSLRIVHRGPNVGEVDFCGHATVALGACLRETGLVDVGSVIIVEQGVDMGRRCILTVGIDGPRAAIRVSGTAVRVV